MDSSDDNVRKQLRELQKLIGSVKDNDQGDDNDDENYDDLDTSNSDSIFANFRTDSENDILDSEKEDIDININNDNNGNNEKKDIVQQDLEGDSINTKENNPQNELENNPDNKEQEISCCYCNSTDKNSLVLCKDCGKHFCNSKDGLREKSHIYNHLVYNKHYNISPVQQKLKIPSLCCCECGSTNIFNLGYLKGKNKKNRGKNINGKYIIVCKEPCLDKYLDNKDDFKGFRSFIENGVFISDFVSSPTKRTLENKGIKIKTINEKIVNDLELKYREETNRDEIVEFIAGNKLVRPVRNQYADLIDYCKVYKKLIRIEWAEEEREARNNSIKSNDVFFETNNGIVTGARARLDFLDFFTSRSKLYDKVIIYAGRFDSIPEGNVWHVNGTITSFENYQYALIDVGSINLQLPKEPPEVYSIFFDLNPYAYQQMTDLLKNIISCEKDYADYCSKLEDENRDVSNKNEGESIQNSSNVINSTKSNNNNNNKRNDKRKRINPQKIKYRSLPSMQLQEVLLGNHVKEYINNIDVSFQFRNYKAVQETMKSIKYFDIPNFRKLNDSQSLAVKTGLVSPCTIIQGPPGTGKTVVSTALIYNIVTATKKAISKTNIKAIKHLKGPKYPREFTNDLLTLVCAPSNVATDQLASYLSKCGINVTRIFSNKAILRGSSVMELGLESKLDALIDDPNLLNDPKYVNPIFKKSAAEYLERIRELLRIEEAVRIGEEDDKLYFLQKRLTQCILASSDVIATTCVMSSSGILNGYRFPVVLIDECTQATEPEALLPICHECEQLILVGDNMQLGPVVTSKLSRAKGLDLSIFQRLIDSGAQLIPLRTQYRMHPQIARYPSDTFYDGILDNGVSIADRTLSQLRCFPFPKPNCPCIFINVEGRDELLPQITSYYNRNEGKMVTDIVSMLLGNGITPKQIGIITPYKAQQTHLEIRIKNIYRNTFGTEEDINDLEIQTVDGFQGREKDIIIISTVRSNPKRDIGFTGGGRRLNVSITRAKYGLIIIGNADTLINSKQRDNAWVDLINYFSVNNMLRTGSLNNLSEYEYNCTNINEEPENGAVDIYFEDLDKFLSKQKAEEDKEDKSRWPKFKANKEAENKNHKENEKASLSNSQKENERDENPEHEEEDLYEHDKGLDLVESIEESDCYDQYADYASQSDY